MPESVSPAANYLTRNNIVHPAHASNMGTTAADARVAVDEAAARAELSARTGLTVTGGAIRKGR